MQATYIAGSQGARPGHIGVHPCYYRLVVASMTTTDDLQKHIVLVCNFIKHTTEHSKQPPQWMHLPPQWMHLPPQLMHLPPQWMHLPPQWMHLPPQWMHSPEQSICSRLACSRQHTLQKLCSHFRPCTNEWRVEEGRGGKGREKRDGMRVQERSR